MGPWHTPLAARVAPTQGFGVLVTHQVLVWQPPSSAFSSAANVEVDRVVGLYGGVSQADLCPLSWLFGAFWKEST